MTRKAIITEFLIYLRCFASSLWFSQYRHARVTFACNPPSAANKGKLPGALIGNDERAQMC